jgi:hypothetical protein
MRSHCTLVGRTQIHMFALVGTGHELPTLSVLFPRAYTVRGSHLLLFCNLSVIVILIPNSQCCVGVGFIFYSVLVPNEWAYR